MSDPTQISCESCHSKFKLDSNRVKPTGILVMCSKCRAVFRVYPSDIVKRRKRSRVKTQNLISYFISRNNTVFFESPLKHLLAIFAKIILRLNHHTYHRELYWKVYQNKEPIFLRLSYSYHIYIRIFSFMFTF